MECLMLFALACLFLSLNLKRDILIAALYLIVAGFLLAEKRREGRRICLHIQKRYILPNLSILLFGVKHFCLYWLPSSKIKALAAAAHMSSGCFLLILGTGAAVFAFFGLNTLWTELASVPIVRRLKEKAEKHPALSDGAMILIVLVLQLLQLQRSSVTDVFYIRPHFAVLNLSILLLINVLFILLTQSRKTGTAAAAAAITLIGIVNCYVIQFHGSPLFPSELVNAETAFNVLSEYRFAVLPETVDVVAVFLTECFVVRFIRKKGHKADAAKQNIRRLSVLAAGGAMICFLLFSDYAPNLSVQWSWQEAVQYIGYPACSVGDVRNMLQPISIPDEYDRDRIDVPTVSSVKPEICPDIVLVLNETFCDPGVFSSIDADTEYLAPFYSIENARFGYAVVPSVGGGTNNTEFELLTSHSMYLVNNSAPFNFIEMDTQETLVSYLERLGYSTAAMHCGAASNYSRHIAYPAMGFDRICLGPEQFSRLNFYGNRPWLDADNYLDMIDLYETAGSEPRFIYLLTMQNHGSYSQNDDSLDLVHTTKDLGDLTDDMNEYLTSVSMSAEAVRNLTDYFSQVDRPVILCMVGDHAPTFITQLEAKREMNDAEREIAQRTVPFMLWSNCGTLFAQDTEYVSMTDLVPLLLSSAGMPLTPYYQEILNLRELLPVRTANGFYMDLRGNTGAYDKDSPYYDVLSQYYYMEYNGISCGDDYIGKLFSTVAE